MNFISAVVVLALCALQVHVGADEERASIPDKTKAKLKGSWYMAIYNEQKQIQDLDNVCRKSTLSLDKDDVLTITTVHTFPDRPNEKSETQTYVGTRTDDGEFVDKKNPTYKWTQNDATPPFVFTFHGVTNSYILFEMEMNNDYYFVVFSKAKVLSAEEKKTVDKIYQVSGKADPNANCQV